MEGSKDWVGRFYVYELSMFLTGSIFLYFGYILTQVLYNYLGVGFILFGMILSLMQKRGG